MLLFSSLSHLDQFILEQQVLKLPGRDDPSHPGVLPDDPTLSDLLAVFGFEDRVIVGEMTPVDA